MEVLLLLLVSDRTCTNYLIAGTIVLLASTCRNTIRSISEHNCITLNSLWAKLKLLIAFRYRRLYKWVASVEFIFRIFNRFRHVDICILGEVTTFMIVFLKAVYDKESMILFKL